MLPIFIYGQRHETADIFDSDQDNLVLLINWFKHGNLTNNVGMAIEMARWNEPRHKTVFLKINFGIEVETFSVRTVFSRK